MGGRGRSFPTAATQTQNSTMRCNSISNRASKRRAYLRASPSHHHTTKNKESPHMHQSGTRASTTPKNPNPRHGQAQAYKRVPYIQHICQPFVPQKHHVVCVCTFVPIYLGAGLRLSVSTWRIRGGHPHVVEAKYGSPHLQQPCHRPITPTSEQPQVRHVAEAVQHLQGVFLAQVGHLPTCGLWAQA